MGVRTLSDVLRKALLAGRSYLRTAGAGWPRDALSDYRDGVWCRRSFWARPRPVGRPTRSPGEDIQTVLAAALKLQQFDPAGR